MGMVYDPRGLPGVSTAGPGLDKVLHRTTTLFWKNFLSSKLVLLHLLKPILQLRGEKPFMLNGELIQGALLFGQRKNI
jgi:hypothetical protein